MVVSTIVVGELLLVPVVVVLVEVVVCLGASDAAQLELVHLDTLRLHVDALALRGALVGVARELVVRVVERV